MIDSSIIITIIPPIVTGVFAYLIAKKKSTLAERINKAKVDADIQSQAFSIVKGVMNDMRDEFKREIEALKEENEVLRKQVSTNDKKIQDLTDQCKASDKLVETLQSEIGALRLTIKVYEKEIERLNNLKL